MTRRQLLGLSPFAALVLFLYAEPRVPYEWGHTLTGACSWHARPALGLLGPVRPPPGSRARRMQDACWYRRGLKSTTPFVKIVLPEFPSAAQLTAWREADANRSPLPAGE